MCIKLWTIYAHKLRFAIDCHTTCTTHTRTIHHDGIETCLGRDIIFLGGQCHKLHHDSRTNRHTLIHLLTIDHLLHARGYQSFLTHRTIIRHDYHLIRDCLQLFLEYNQLCCTSRQYRYHSVTTRLQSFGYRQHRRSTYTTASTYHSAEILNIRRLAQWSNQVCYLITWF